MEELSFHYSSVSSCPIIDSDFLRDDGYEQSIMGTATEAQCYEVGLMEGADLIKAQIANHPLYPTLLSSYIDCRKVGAPPEMAAVLEEISNENQHIFVSSEIGTNPELDLFMKSYYEALKKYKEEIWKPFDEATNFLSSIGSQLTDLCKETLPSSATFSHHSTDSGGCASDEEISCGDVVEASGNGDGDLKEMLMRKYSGYVTTLRKEMLKKRKKGKLPKDAISALLDWWNTHFRWPYPTEEEKNRLSETTGLDHKQINNWFINQRKRHWRPSEDMRFALMEGVGGGAAVYFDGVYTGGGGGDDNISTN